MDGLMGKRVVPFVSAKRVSHVIVADRHSYVALYTALGELGEDQLVDLIAISWIGAGRFAPEDFIEARPRANALHRGGAARTLLGTPKLADLLEDGLSALMLATGGSRWPAAQEAAGNRPTPRAERRAAIAGAAAPRS